MVFGHQREVLLVILRYILSCSNSLLQHSRSMVPSKNLILSAVVPDSVVVVVSQARASVVGTELPELVHRDSSVIEYGHLPWHLDSCVVVWRRRAAILLEHDGLVQRSADSVVLLDPGASPGLVVSPAVWVEVERSLYPVLASLPVREHETEWLT